MRVRLTCDRAGATFIQHEGDEIELPDKEAMRLIAAGQAEATEPESMALRQSETAVLTRPRFRGQRK